jgi:hypothetical protein
MTRFMTKAAMAAVVLLTAGTALGQEQTTRPGWTFVPAFGYSQTFDDNVTLFGEADLTTSNNDLITVYTPQADLTFLSRQTRFTGGYSGSLLDYRTFSVFNRWDQHAQVSLRRLESARLHWDIQGNLTLTPSTDALEFNGIPFSNTGARALNARGTVEYQLSARDTISTSLIRQKVTFDRPDELLWYLRGGESMESLTQYRRRVNARLGAGANYSVRRASAVDAPGDLTFHATRGAIDYRLSSFWTVNAGFGVDYIPATLITPAQSAPGWSASASWSSRSRRFQVGYQRMFLPSFGFGGALQNRQFDASFHSPLFRNRRLYTQHTFALNANDPLIEAPGRLRLRTLRFNSSVGWTPQPWIRVEGFFGRAQQTTFLPGGDIGRNRFGFVIVTSRPVRVQ